MNFGAEEIESEANVLAKSGSEVKVGREQRKGLEQLELIVSARGGKEEDERR